MKKYNFLSQSIFSISEVKKEISDSSSCFYTLKKLCENNIIKKIKGGLYATVNPITGDIMANKYELSTAMVKNGILGYHSALEYYGLHNQMFCEIQIIVPERCVKQEYEWYTFNFYLDDYNEGIIERYQNSLIRVTDLERTIVNCVDRLDLAGGIEELFSALSLLNYFDERKILKYLEYYNKKFLYKKMGFIFSLLNNKYISNDFYKICMENMSNRTDDIRENLAMPYIYDDDWKIYAPQYIINTEN